MQSQLTHSSEEKDDSANLERHLTHVGPISCGQALKAKDAKRLAANKSSKSIDSAGIDFSLRAQRWSSQHLMSYHLRSCFGARSLRILPIPARNSSERTCHRKHCKDVRAWM